MEISDYLCIPTRSCYANVMLCTIFRYQPKQIEQEKRLCVHQSPVQSPVSSGLHHGTTSYVGNRDEKYPNFRSDSPIHTFGGCEIITATSTRSLEGAVRFLTLLRMTIPLLIGVVCPSTASILERGLSLYQVKSLLLKSYLTSYWGVSKFRYQWGKRPGPDLDGEQTIKR